MCCVLTVFVCAAENLKEKQSREKEKLVMVVLLSIVAVCQKHNRMFIVWAQHEATWHQRCK